jgi:hypothetical protein
MTSVSQLWGEVVGLLDWLDQHNGAVTAVATIVVKVVYQENEGVRWAPNQRPHLARR